MVIFGTPSTLSSQLPECQVEPVDGYAMAKGNPDSRKPQNIDAEKRQSKDHHCVCDPRSYKQSTYINTHIYIKSIF